MSDESNNTVPPKPAQKSEKLFNMPCRSGFSCKSTLAVEVAPNATPEGVHHYRCIQCNAMWTIALGGGVNF